MRNHMPVGLHVGSHAGRELTADPSNFLPPFAHMTTGPPSAVLGRLPPTVVFWTTASALETLGSD